MHYHVRPLIVLAVAHNLEDLSLLARLQPADVCQSSTRCESNPSTTGVWSAGNAAAVFLLGRASRPTSVRWRRQPHWPTPSRWLRPSRWRSTLNADLEDPSRGWVSGLQAVLEHSCLCLFVTHDQPHSRHLLRVLTLPSLGSRIHDRQLTSSAASSASSSPPVSTRAAVCAGSYARVSSLSNISMNVSRVEVTTVQLCTASHSAKRSWYRKASRLGACSRGEQAQHLGCVLPGASLSEHAVQPQPSTASQVSNASASCPAHLLDQQRSGPRMESPCQAGACITGQRASHLEGMPPCTAAFAARAALSSTVLAPGQAEGADNRSETVTCAICQQPVPGACLRRHCCCTPLSPATGGRTSWRRGRLTEPTDPTPLAGQQRPVPRACPWPPCYCTGQGRTR